MAFSQAAVKLYKYCTYGTVGIYTYDHFIVVVTLYVMHIIHLTEMDFYVFITSH